ncbi:hypothetical protein CWR43_27400 [Rhizobium sullae]|uniref:Uncharacterized protein n=1 Tax=Rhizobium sullae TaxID=50338 RepID=A0A2N0D2H1_RHISU|nr:hypothetical protein CWR43_27400 [Rhizobium sullae]
MPDVPALFDFSILLRRKDAHPSRRFFYAAIRRQVRFGAGGRPAVEFCEKSTLRLELQKIDSEESWATSRRR